MKSLHWLEEFLVNCHGESKSDLAVVSSCEWFLLDLNVVLIPRSDALTIEPESKPTVSVVKPAKQHSTLYVSLRPKIFNRWMLSSCEEA